MHEQITGQDLMLLSALILLHSCNHICKNKGADHLRSDCEAGQCLCFRYKDSTISLSKYKISSLLPFSVLVQLGLCGTCSETMLLVFVSYVTSGGCLVIINLFSDLADSRLTP